MVVLGGAKVADKFGAIASLIAAADRILIGGAMAFPFLAAQGREVGTSLLKASQVEVAAGYLDQAARAGTEIVLPSDVIVAGERAADAPHELGTDGEHSRLTDLRQVLTISPGNTLRAPVKHLEAIITVLEDPYGIPLQYHIGEDERPA